MIERPLMTADELKSIPKGNFMVMKTGTHPMRTKLRLFLDWGITFDGVYAVPEKGNRKVTYADKQTLEENIVQKHLSCFTMPGDDDTEEREVPRGTGTLHTPVESPDGASHRRSILRT